MQILIISLPSGEQVTSLSYTIDSEEVIIGRSPSCQILLPDQQQQVVERHARIYREDDYWFLENLSDSTLLVNMVKLQSGRNQRQLLNDGDIIACGEYRLMVNDFSPWQEASGKSLSTPQLPDTPAYSPDVCLIPNAGNMPLEARLEDPFDHSEPTEQATDISKDHEEISMKIQPEEVIANSTHNLQSKPLIDVLVESNDDDDDWSINRNLWAGESLKKQKQEQKQEQKISTQSVPLLSELVVANEQFPEKMAPRHTARPERKSNCQAMLQALEWMLEEFAPEKLEKQFVQKTESKNHSRRFFSTAPDRRQDYWNQYQNFYQKWMTDQDYRLLFLHRFREAMKQQEP